METDHLVNLIAGVAKEFEQEIERAVRHKDMAQATMALGGKDACQRIKNSLLHHAGPSIDERAKREAEYEAQRSAQAERRKIRREIRDARERGEIKSAELSPEALQFIATNSSTAHDHVQRLRHQRTQLLKAIDGRSARRKCS